MARIAVYAGHGGSDSGAVGNGFREKDLTLAVSNQASNILRGWGYTVINNRTTDVDRSITRDANLANSSGVEALVEIHLNSNNGPPATGTEAFISIRNIGRSRALANAMLQRIAALGYVNRGVKTQVNAAGQDAFGILRLTNMPAVLLELAFINNPQDMARFNVGEMAWAVAAGIRDVFPIGGGGGGFPPYPGTAIRVGARGESVRQIQQCLNRANNAGLNADGIFGPLTQNAVINFQRSRGLSPDGVVGPLTWGRLAQECSGGIMSPYPGTAIRVGARGESVRQIQSCLNRVNNARINADGIFGPLTQNAVINFQRSRGLSPDGVVGDAVIIRPTQKPSRFKGFGVWSYFLQLNNSRLCQPTSA